MAFSRPDSPFDMHLLELLHLQAVTLSHNKVMVRDPFLRVRPSVAALAAAANLTLSAGRPPTVAPAGIPERNLPQDGKVALACDSCVEPLSVGDYSAMLVNRCSSMYTYATRNAVITVQGMKITI